MKRPHQDSPTVPTPGYSACRRAAGAVALWVWQTAPPRFRNREWFRDLFLSAAARHAVASHRR